MPTPTYDLIASNVLGSNATSVTFSSLDTIAASYRDLIVVQSARVVTTSDSFRIRINGDTGTNYNAVRMRGDGSAASSNSASSAAGPVYMTQSDTLSSTTRDVSIIHFFDFSQTNKHKTFLARIDNSALSTNAGAYRWASTSAITSIELTSNDTFQSGSSFYLYGIVS
jgi:hypothetical protein